MIHISARGNGALAKIIGEELIQLEFILPVAAKIFKEWSLNIKEVKTEFIHFYYTEPDKDNKEEVP